MYGKAPDNVLIREPVWHLGRLYYTDNSVDEKGNVRAYGSVVTQEGDLMKLEPITTEKEWKVIEMALNVIQEQSKNEEDK